jgi:hypothetical protein
MHSYPTHISQQQRIKRLRPDLKAGIAKPVVMDMAAAPVADLLPLRIPTTSEHRRVDVKRIDDKNASLSLKPPHCSAGVSATPSPSASSNATSSSKRETGRQVLASASSGCAQTTAYSSRGWRTNSSRGQRRPLDP